MEGINWVLLTSDLTTAQYDWDTRTIADGSTYLVKIGATCAEGFTVTDISDGIFNIQNVPPDTTPTSTSEEASSEKVAIIGRADGIILLALSGALVYIRRRRRQKG